MAETGVFKVVERLSAVQRRDVRIFRGVLFAVCRCAEQFFLMLGVKRGQPFMRDFSGWQIKLQRAVTQADDPLKAFCNIDLMQGGDQCCAMLACRPGQGVDGLRRPRRIE